MSKKEKKMSEADAPAARPNVVFHLSGDALAPREVPWGAVLRLPIPAKVEAGRSTRLNYLVAASLPCLVVPMRRLAEYGLELLEEGEIIPAGTEFSFVVRNPGKTDVFLEERDSVVSVHPLFWTGGFAVEG